MERNTLERRGHLVQTTHWSAFYLLLLLLVVVSLLIGVGLEVIHLFGPSLGTSDATPKLDSFSQPSIAAAILRQYAHRTDEVVDALRHVARFHPDPKTAKVLKAVLEEWTKDPAGFDVPNQ